MKHSTSVLLSAPLLVASCMLQSACAEPPLTGPVYDFDWHLGGATDIRPYQVFDDGQKIYLQFDDPRHVPAIFADTPGGLALLRWRPDPPYVVVDQMKPALVFRAAGQIARATRAIPDGPPGAAHYGTARPKTETSAIRSSHTDRAATHDTEPPSNNR
ncbi:TrbG/VirB9 family P-type conjugative transfer protein [Paraburkholderia sp. BL25I1N1]|uniref:TrbG/VirB9 family P-type conjugative transfer protein n=1 Tax=Paraburkholderia sp. BL25I1N1 TaxID=1938804 RepID=UPI000D084D4B|nr:TrbG/VirB9 family P-type conjugative transfer protein [Paraburkholderia sp. BL25I1N1]PRY06123.1 conjugative transfer protein CagX [Paraburkholderia sp. BL25I1N1]